MRRVILALLLTVAAATPVVAQPQYPSGLQSEQIDSFDSAVTVRPDGTAEVVETITYNFGSSYRHGIYRYVPVQYQDAAGQKFYTEFIAKSVTDQRGKKYHYENISSTGTRALKIGDADKTITGQHVYRITYQLRPAVQQGRGEDVFADNVTGNDWKVPILAAKSTITFPSNLTPKQSTCYTGTTGSTASECAQNVSQNVVTTTANRALQPGEGLSVFTTLPPGGFSDYLIAGQKVPIHWQRYLGYAAGVLLLVLAIIWRLIGWLNYRIRRARSTEVVQFASPDQLTPAELGMLIDSRGSMTEVTATIIDLAVRGYLKIEQVSKARLGAKAGYQFSKLRSTDGLSSAEQGLFTAIFSSSDRVTLSQLRRGAMAEAVTAFQAATKTSLQQKGYTTKIQQSWPRWLLLLLTVAALGLLTVVGLSGTSLGNWIGNAAVLLTGLLVLIAAGFRRSLTTAGYTEWGEVAGFRRFLSMTEKERLAFTDAPKRNPQQFSALLPAAVALGVEKEWAKQFAGLDVSKAINTWYVGQQPLTAPSLAGDLRGLGGAVSSSFAPISSSSGSSSSSGGFSGGGVGGGGGGSW